MKAGFGLVALLVTAAIIFSLWTKNTAEVVEKSKPAMQQAQQWAGQDETGMRAKDSIKLEPVLQGGKIRYALVDSIVAGGPMEKFFGLKQNDAIVKIVTQGLTMDVKEMSSDEVKDFVLDAFTKSGKLVVMRDGEELELPQARPAANPRRENTSPLHQQLDAIQRVP